MTTLPTVNEISGTCSTSNCKGSPTNECPSSTYWGVDSAAAVNSTFYNCVVSNFGTPTFWGRYLTTVIGYDDGLSSAEITLFHDNGVKILVIYNGFGGSATGNSNGIAAANNAISYAQNTLNVPSGVAIFADIEASYPVDAGWIEGWCDTFASSIYTPGFYMNPIPQSSDFNNAYCSALSSDSNVSEALLWSNEPETGVTGKSTAPAWGPDTPTCNSNVLAWQYGENNSQCGTLYPIDSDECSSDLIPYLW